MKLIQLNLWMGKFGIAMLEFLKREKPDLLCVQEVIDLPGPSGMNFFTTLSEIQETCDFQEAFMSATFSANFMQRQYNYGNATLSRLPFGTKETVFTNGSYMENFDNTVSDVNIRNLQISKIKTGDTYINVLNHHGYHIPGTKLGNEKTTRQMQIIADAIDKLNGPVILCGDFNLTPGSESIKVIDAKLTNLSVQNGLQTTCSNPFTNIHGVLDYIFVNDSIRVKSFRAADEVVSDHKALILEFNV